MSSSKKTLPDISYYRLSLEDFLRESHPERLSDNDFITARSEAAAETYTQAILNGDNNMEADEQARIILFQDLSFSKHDTLVNILWNEFSDTVPEGEASPLAIRLLPVSEPTFATYPLSDDFAYEPAFDLLYTELTGIIDIYLGVYGL